MGITREYFAMQKHFQEKYGDNTLCLIQVGSFYEMYEYDPKHADKQITNDQNNLSLKFSLNIDKQINEKSLNICSNLNNNEGIGHAVEISIILNMKLTSKNKDKPHSMDNPMLVGFPCPKYETHRDMILFHSYTIVRIDQKDRNSDTENVERNVVEISSPGTEIENSIVIQMAPTNNIVSIYIECQKCGKNLDNNIILCGLSCIDVSTGKNMICEVYSKEKDEIYALQEIYRFLISQKPVEIILYVTNVIGNIESYMSYLN